MYLPVVGKSARGSEVIKADRNRWTEKEGERQRDRGRQEDRIRQRQRERTEREGDRGKE